MEPGLTVIDLDGSNSESVGLASAIVDRRDLIHLALVLLRQQRLAHSTDLATRRPMHRWKEHDLSFSSVPSSACCDLILVIGRLRKVRVTK